MEEVKMEPAEEAMEEVAGEEEREVVVETRVLKSSDKDENGQLLKTCRRVG